MLCLRLVLILVGEKVSQIPDNADPSVGYAAVTFPSVTEAVEAGNFSLAEEWVTKTAAGIRVAGDILKT